MKNIVLLPCFRRPDFLAANLAYIQMADGWENNLYYFSVDVKEGNAPDSQVLKVIKAFPGEKRVKVRGNSYHGNSFNVLEAYRECFAWAQDSGASLIYLIETDIFIGRDFFTFHEGVQAISDEFYVSACDNLTCSREYLLPPDPAGVYPFHNFQSLGISIKVQWFPSILEHAVPDYYENMKGYVEETFPESRYRGRYFEQDGLINRVMEAQHSEGLFPFVARAFHAGFHGYNRRGTALAHEIPLEERKNQLMAMTEQEMNHRAGSAKYTDIRKCDLNGHEVDAFEIFRGALVRR